MNQVETITKDVEYVVDDKLAKLREGLRLCAWAPVISILLYIVAIIVIRSTVFHVNFLKLSRILDNLSSVFIIFSILWLIPPVLNIVGLSKCQSSFRTYSVSNAFSTMKVMAIIGFCLSLLSTILTLSGSSLLGKSFSILDLIYLISGIVSIVTMFVNRSMCGRLDTNTNISGMGVARTGYSVLLYTLGITIAVVIVISSSHRFMSSEISILILLALLTGAVMIIAGWFMAAYAYRGAIEAVED